MVEGPMSVPISLAAALRALSKETGWCGREGGRASHMEYISLLGRKNPHSSLTTA